MNPNIITINNKPYPKEEIRQAYFLGIGIDRMAAYYNIEKAQMSRILFNVLKLPKYNTAEFHLQRNQNLRRFTTVVIKEPYMRCKGKFVDVNLLMKMYYEGMSYAEIGKKFKLDEYNIAYILKQRLKLSRDNKKIAQIKDIYNSVIIKKKTKKKKKAEGEVKKRKVCPKPQKSTPNENPVTSTTIMLIQHYAIDNLNEGFSLEQNIADICHILNREKSFVEPLVIAIIEKLGGASSHSCNN